MNDTTDSTGKQLVCSYFETVRNMFEEVGEYKDGATSADWDELTVHTETCEHCRRLSDQYEQECPDDERTRAVYTSGDSKHPDWEWLERHLDEADCFSCASFMRAWDRSHPMPPWMRNILAAYRAIRDGCPPPESYEVDSPDGKVLTHASWCADCSKRRSAGMWKRIERLIQSERMDIYSQDRGPVRYGDISHAYDLKRDGSQRDTYYLLLTGVGAPRVRKVKMNLRIELGDQSCVVAIQTEASHFTLMNEQAITLIEGGGTVIAENIERLT